MTTFQYIKHLLCFILFNIYKIYYHFTNIFTYSQSHTPILPPKPTPTEIYLLDKHTFFNKNKETIQSQSQIESFFYNKHIYNETLKEPQNNFEKQWKTRILFENTPRGNVIMFYDIYKMGFYYFSDQQAITYDILNAIAMKYVVLFRCIDFFIDEKYHTSPFLELYEMPTTKETHTQKRIHQQNNSIRTMMKIQNQSVPVLNTKPTPTSAVEMMTIKNRFLYQGKIANFSFCQKILKKRVIIKHNTFNALFENNPQMSYSDFKKSIADNNKQTTSTS